MRCRDMPPLPKRSGAGRRQEATDPDWMRRRARERALLYADVASQIVDVDEATPPEVARRILDAVGGPRSGEAAPPPS